MVGLTKCERAKMESTEYIIRVALSENIDSPYIWFSSLPCGSREIVKITNTNTSKSVWCEVVKASDNFIERYTRNPRTKPINREHSFVVVNEWYRKELGLIENSHSSIEIKTSKMPLFIKQLLAS